ncbi:hypothetical protein [Brucella rhizosphaerae]|uniref:Uncharacterized protein n=1 Tax=Brucella rhizosphaerae TaxID=571254 RepID=A0A256FU99_9HYPH|nr:hypothetical protein [Brucella rhizosphaerae]OYR18404.1 hypothetical protein CEV32_3286 [Brucella rhizosphaerae]
MQPSEPITTTELRIVDADGHPRLLLSVKDGLPTVAFMNTQGDVGMRLQLDSQGLPSVVLANPDPTGPTARFEIDGKGAHVKLDGADAASAYLFLNNGSTSGLVLNDANGQRRIGATVTADGISQIVSYDDSGAPITNDTTG